MHDNYTWMDMFDRGIESMCYNVNTDDMASFKNADAALYNSLMAYQQKPIQPIKEKLSVKSFPHLVSFCSWHIKRSDLLTLGGTI